MKRSNHDNSSRDYRTDAEKTPGGLTKPRPDNNRHIERTPELPQVAQKMQTQNLRDDQNGCSPCHQSGKSHHDQQETP